MAILDRLPANRPDADPASTAPSFSTSKAQDLAQLYRDRLIERLSQEELDNLVNLPPRTRESRIAGWVTDMMREDGSILRSDLLSDIIDVVQNEMVGLGPLQPLLRDPSITEIMVNWVRRSEHDPEGYSRIFIEQEGIIRHAPPEIRFKDQAHLRHIIDRIVSPLGRRIDESSPRVDARLPEGHRVNAIIPPLAVDGPLLTIRKFRPLPFTADDLVRRHDTLAASMMTFLKAAVRARLNILISGGTGSGKTTTLNVLASFIPDNERIITIEDAAELRFQETHPHVLRLESRPANVEGEGEVTIQELVKNALRMRPDRIIIGEVRGGEAFDMLQAMNTGHEGSMTSVHANSTRDAFTRIENMVMMAESAGQLPVEPIREQLASAIDIVIQQSRLPGGQRKIVSISEVIGLRKGSLVLKDLFFFQQTGVDARGRVEGYFTPTGVLPRCLPRLREALPAAEYAELAGIFSLDYFVRELGQLLMRDRTINEIMINKPDEIYIEQRGKLRRLTPEEIRAFGGEGFEHVTQLEHVIATVAARLGRRIDEKRPMIDARLPDGSRVNAILPPLALDPMTGHQAQEDEASSPVITIRRFPDPLGIERLLTLASLSEPMAAFLRAAVEARVNLLISGGTGSGKTTLLNTLSAFIPAGQRIITIEDVAELQLKQPHWIRLETRPSDEYGEGEVTIRDLVRNSLRMRPDRIIVGECRGPEALDMLQAMNTGHSGSLTTLHANSPRDAFSRLEAMVRMAPEARELSARELYGQMSVIDLVVQVGRLADGSRKVTSISEVLRSEGSVELAEIFRFEQTGLITAAEPQVIGRFLPTDYVPQLCAGLRGFGFSFEDDFFSAGNEVKVEGDHLV